MKPPRTRPQEARKQLGIPWEVLERDYLLSWILAGIGQVESLREEVCGAASKLLDEYAPAEIACSPPSRRPGTSGSVRWCPGCPPSIP